MEPLYISANFLQFWCTLTFPFLYSYIRSNMSITMSMLIKDYEGSPFSSYKKRCVLIVLITNSVNRNTPTESTAQCKYGTALHLADGISTCSQFRHDCC